MAKIKSEDLGFIFVMMGAAAGFSLGFLLYIALRTVY
jgi:hypothetical protein